ncbi:TonB-dependent receptor [Parahaliea sp. F7430]|uniref:TonB-dependent receptor n=1 Tax=Sediminihaliea albiluteola TaxID=2758564 RepID=A0A7W2TTD1_9GAMM|nr:TonB-dependent receptor [Sediminihaliea albiluteola]MBA6411609.1 TonB-dependent receptor [Sediminihaliea albiluteola]
MSYRNYRSDAREGLRKYVLVPSILTALAYPSLALAQGSGKLEEVVVSARKIQEGLQDTPIAVSAYSNQTLREMGLEALTSISTSTPNLQLQRNAGGDSSLTACMRGLCRSDDIITEEPMVGTYIDGFYISRMQGAFFDLLDVQQIEVLRGPQGTLFGKNTAGGAINITTVRPSGELGGYVEGTLGSDSLKGAKFSLDMPMSDHLAGRISYGQQKRDGLIKNTTFSDLNDKDYQTARIALAADFNSRFTADYTFDWFDAKQTPNGWQPTLIEEGLEVVFPGIASTSAADLERRVSTPEDVYDNSRQLFNGLTLAYEVGDTAVVDDLTIKSLTGYRRSKLSSFRTMVPYYFISGPLEQTYDFFTQEFQFLGTALDERLSIVSGLFFSKDDGEYQLKQQFGSSVPNTVLNLDTETETWAVYAELSYHLNDRWKASLGARYTEEEKEVNSSIFFPSTGGTLPVSALAPSNEFDTDNFSPRLTVSYQPTDFTMLYATYSVGFKSGGLNGRATQVPDFSVYDDAEITSYEVGVKSDLFDDRLRLNMAVFYQEVDDWQVQVNSIDRETFTFLSRIENAAAATMTGAELEATFVVSDSFQINGSLGWIDPEYDTYLSQDFTTLEFVDVADQYNFQFSPEWTGHITARYEKHFEKLGNLVARVDWSYVGDQHFIVSPSPLIDGDSYTLVDARLELRELWGSNFALALWGKNIGDEEYRSGGFDVPTFGINPPDGLYANSWGNTRTWGLDLRYDF